jgi:FkbM family methyltransferase
MSSKRDSSLLKKIKKKDRYRNGSVIINNDNIEYIDSLSFYYQYKEIFEKKIYNFYSPCSSPYIIDCGSNIGLGILFFKKIYPKSKVLGFEPDTSIFPVLEKNILRNNCKDVTLINKAVWTNEANLNFIPDGSDGGRIPLEMGEAKRSVSVPTACLSNFLDEHVDFLKIDIEGAETLVLQSCKEKLNNIKNIFIEYHSIFKEKQTLHQLLTILSEAEFRVYIHSVSKNIQPFLREERDVLFDMQLNIFAFRDAGKCNR